MARALTAVKLLASVYLILLISSNSAHGQNDTLTVEATRARAAAAAVQPARPDNQAHEGGLMQFPVVSRTHIAFVYSGEIWAAPRTAGGGVGVAVQLTRAPGAKYRLAFSPDGQTIAFSALLDSNPNIYTVPLKSAGGGGGAAAAATPTRITHLPFNVNLCQWTKANELLFYTDSLSFNLLAMQLFTVPASGGLPVKLPVPYGSEAALSPDGEWLAYTPYWPATNLRQVRRRYMGGIAPDIWLFNLRTHASKKITDWRGSDTRPMWHGRKLYYLSDRGPEHRMNIWAYDLASGLHQQLTTFRDYDINNPSLGQGMGGKDAEIIFQNGPEIYLLDLGTGRASLVDVSLPSTEQSARRREVDAAKFITNSELSPAGDSVLVGARGDIWIISTQGNGAAPRNLSRTSGVFERDPAWSPDGRRITYLADATGEYELYLTGADGTGETRQLTRLGQGFRYSPRWSPDSGKIVFTDKRGAIFVHNISSGETKQIDIDPWSQQPAPVWSPDSAWLAYTKVGDNRLTALWLYNTATGEKHQASTAMFNASSPAFDLRGDYLYYISERRFSSPILDALNRTFVYRDTSAIMVLPLRAGVSSPLSPELKPAQSVEASSGGVTRTSPPAAQSSVQSRAPFSIDFEGLERRELLLPTQCGVLFNLDVTAEGNPIYSCVNRAGESSIRIFNLTGEKKEEQTVLAEAADFQLSQGSGKALVRKDGSLYVIAAAPEQKLSSPIKTDGMTMTIDLRAEWRQIFTDTWRLFRDFFYAPDMNGVDWPNARARYQKMLERCMTREDLNYVIGELIAEVNTGHAWLSNPGDVLRAPKGSVAMLGADFGLENGAYRITKLYEGAPWDTSARNPLRGAGIKEGDYLLAVNGAPLDLSKDPLAALQNKAQTPVTLTISSQSDGKQSARAVVVVPLPDDSNLRYRAWVESNRRMVEQRTAGQVGYIHITDFNLGGLNEFVRQYNGQVNKKALIIDPRWSQGGALGDVLAHLLNQPGLNYYAERESLNNWPVPARAHLGPKCVLINHLVISAGENFSYFFRKLGLGKLIGARTWGGLVGLNGNPSLIDGGYVNIPNAAFFSNDGKWLIENHGLEPDIEVIDDPSLMVEGDDPQLEAAIRLMLQEIKSNVNQPPSRPAYPDRTRMGIRQEEK